MKPERVDVAEFVTDLAMDVGGLLDQAPSDSAVEALAAGYFLVTGEAPKDVGKDGAQTLASAARVGYLSRVVEYGQLANARTMGTDWGVIVETEISSRRGEAVGAEDALAQLAAGCVNAEDLDPRPDDESTFSFIVPGLDAALRGALRDVTLAFVAQAQGGHLVGPRGPVDGLELDDLALAWKFGFFYRAIEDHFVERREHGVEPGQPSRSQP